LDGRIYRRPDTVADALENLFPAVKADPHARCDGRTPPGVVLALLGAMLIPLIVYGAAPAWWSERQVTIANVAHDDHAPVNQGQLKTVAKAAILEMDATLPSGAG